MVKKFTLCRFPQLTEFMTWEKKKKIVQKTQSLFFLWILDTTVEHNVEYTMTHQRRGPQNSHCNTLTPNSKKVTIDNGTVTEIRSPLLQGQKKNKYSVVHIV